MHTTPSLTGWIQRFVPHTVTVGHDERLRACIGALFGQYLGNKGSSLAGLTSTTPGGFNGLIYQAKTTLGATAGFYDVASGSNNLTLSPCAICSAASGYDDVTGLGAPNVSALFSNF